MRQQAQIIFKPGRELNLWEKFLRGDKEAFAQLYNEYVGALISYGYRISNDEHIVKDAIQDLFIELWRSRSNQEQPVKHIKSYLFSALRYKLLRNEKVSRLYRTVEMVEDNIIDEVSVESIINQREEETETLKKIGTAVKTLSKRQQEAVTLKFYHGFTNEQISEIMGVNYQSATNILHRSLLILRRHFKVYIHLLFLFLFAA